MIYGQFFSGPSILRVLLTVCLSLSPPLTNTPQSTGQEYRRIPTPLIRLFAKRPVCC